MAFDKYIPDFTPFPTQAIFRFIGFDSSII